MTTMMPLADLIARVKDAREKAIRGWDNRYYDHNGSRSLATKALKSAFDLIDNESAGIAALCLAFHSLRDNEFIPARKQLATAFGELAMSDQRRYLGCAHILRARLGIESEEVELAKRALENARSYFDDLVDLERVELLYEQAGIHRRASEYGKAFARLADAESFTFETAESTTAQTFLNVGMSSLFIRAKEFRVAQSVLSKMSAEQDPNGHVWAANFIACSIRLGDFEAARLAARRLANSNLPGSGSVGYTWGAIALCAKNGNGVCDDPGPCFGWCGPGCNNPGQITTPACLAHDYCVCAYGHSACIIDFPTECAACGSLVDAVISFAGEFLEWFLSWFSDESGGDPCDWENPICQGG
jgi:hypothetical protein